MDTGPAREVVAAGKILSVLRGLRGLTQQQLAAGAGLNKTAISDYETGKREIPDPKRQRLLAALGLPIRAWDDTARHVEWLEWLAAGHGTAPGGEAPFRRRTDVEDRRSSSALDAHSEIRHIAESAGRDVERYLAEVLGILTRTGR